MPVVDVVNLDGKKVGEVELADAVFGAKVNARTLFADKCAEPITDPILQLVGKCKVATAPARI